MLLTYQLQSTILLKTTLLLYLKSRFYFSLSVNFKYLIAILKMYFNFILESL